MKDMLLEWIREDKTHLENMGYIVSINQSLIPHVGVNIDLDNDEFAGRICHWQPDIFEFQFHSMLTGNVILLETVNLGNPAALHAYVMELLTNRLPALDPHKSFTVS